MLFRIPYYNPPWNPGQQLVNFGQGGPSSHPGEQLTSPRIYPTVYNVGTYGMASMPRQVIGPTQPIFVNAFADPRTIQNLAIAGIMKNPRGG